MPKLLKVDEEMQRWCALLEEDMSSWPRVITKPMFGMVMLYRDRNIFGALPRTRAAVTKRSVLVKLPPEKVKQTKPVSKSGSGWIKFELNSKRDVNRALALLQEAYEKAKGK